MRILHVMEATIGGTRRHLRDVVGGLALRGHEVCAVASAERMPAVRGDFEALRALGVRVEELPMVRAIRPGIDRRHGRALAATLRDWRPEIVHTHSSKAGVLGRWASLRTGIGARVHTPHTFAFLFEAMFSPAKRCLFRAVETWFARRTQRLVAVSEGEGETMRNSGVVAAEKVRVVPNAIDPGPWARAEPLARSAFGVPEGPPLFALLGLLNRAKGQDLAIRALAAADGEPAHLVLVGHGEEEAALRALTRELGLVQRVHFLGWRDDPQRLLAAADALLLPSRWEGMPYAVLEAMAAGKPVLAAAVDGARDLVVHGETGLLCAVDDAGALAGALGHFLSLSAEARAALGRAGARRLDQRFSPQTMLAGLEGVYAEALGERS